MYKNGAYVGEMTNGCWSPRAETVIGFILVGVDVQPVERVEVHRDGNIDTGTVCELPFFLTADVSSETVAFITRLGQG